MGAYLVEEPFGELLKALGADKALLVVQLTIAVDDFLSRGKATSAALTDGICKCVCHVAVVKKKKERKLAQIDNTTACGSLFFSQSRLHQPNSKPPNTSFSMDLMTCGIPSETKPPFPPASKLFTNKNPTTHSNNY